MNKEFLNKAKAFSIPSRAWYSSAFAREPDCIMIGFYYDNDGTEGEFKLEWSRIGIQLQVFNDAWEALSRMPELLELMAKLDREEVEPTVDEFAVLLKELGYKDITQYTCEYTRKNNGYFTDV